MSYEFKEDPEDKDALLLIVHVGFVGVADGLVDRRAVLPSLLDFRGWDPGLRGGQGGMDDSASAPI